MPHPHKRRLNEALMLQATMHAAMMVDELGADAADEKRNTFIIRNDEPVPYVMQPPPILDEPRPIRTGRNTIRKSRSKYSPVAEDHKHAKE